MEYNPDFIKIWYITQKDSNGFENHACKNLPIIKAIIDEAHKNNLKVAVHATQQITAQLAVESGCDFLVHSIDDEVVSDKFIQLLKEKGMLIEENPDIAAFRAKVANLKDIELYKDPRVQALLIKMLDAVK